MIRRSFDPRFRSGLGRVAVGSLAVAATLLASPAGLLAEAAAEGGAGHGAGGGGELLVPPNVWAIVSFVLVLFVLVTKLLPPILRVLDKRARDIGDALDAAERARAETKSLLESHAAEMQKARQEALAIIEEGKADAHRTRETIVAAARKEAEEAVERAKREIDQAKHSALDEMHRGAVNLAVDLAGRLIKKSLSAADHQQLIQESIRKLPSA